MVQLVHIHRFRIKQDFEKEMNSCYCGLFTKLKSKIKRSPCVGSLVAASHINGELSKVFVAGRGIDQLQRPDSPHISF